MSISKLKDQLQKNRQIQNIYEEEIHYLEEMLITTFGNCDVIIGDLTRNKREYCNLQTASVNIMKLIKLEEERSNV